MTDMTEPGAGAVEQEQLSPTEKLLLSIGTFTVDDMAEGHENETVNRRIRDILYGFQNPGNERVDMPDHEKLVALLLLEAQLGEKFFAEFRNLPLNSTSDLPSERMLQRLRQSRQTVEGRMRLADQNSQISAADTLAARLQRVRTARAGQTASGGAGSPPTPPTPAA